MSLSTYPTQFAVELIVFEAYELSLKEGLRLERRTFHSLFATNDQKEGTHTIESTTVLPLIYILLQAWELSQKRERPTSLTLRGVGKILEMYHTPSHALDMSGNIKISSCCADGDQGLLAVASCRFLSLNTFCRISQRPSCRHAAALLLKISFIS